MEEEAFYHFNQQLLPKELEKGAVSEMRNIEFNMWPVEGWDGGISYNGECLVVWNKKNCSKMVKMNFNQQAKSKGA